MKKSISIILILLCTVLGMQGFIYAQEASGKGLSSKYVECEPDDKTIRKISATGTLEADSDAKVLFDEATPLEFTASERIVMKPGFIAKPGSNFKAYIEDCECCGKSAIAESKVFSNVMSFEDPLVDRVNVFPNPFTESVNIQYSLGTESDVKVDVYDIFGRLISEPVDHRQQVGAHSFTLETDDFPAGTYIYQVMIGDQQISKKLVKVH